MRYKFSLSPSIKATVEWQLQYYREDCRQLEEFKRDMIPSATPAYSADPSGNHEVHRSTEDITFRIISSPYLRRLETSCDAIRRALDACDKIDLQLIDLIYWRREYTVEGASLVVHLGKSAAYQRINNILGRIAYEMGYVSV